MDTELIEVRRADVNGPEALPLLKELNDALIRITGVNGARYFHPEDMRNPRAAFMIAYLNGVPYGCGALREMSEDTGELKRIYARQNHAGVAHRLMRTLEEVAAANGFTRLALQTRCVNKHALRFYQDCGYRVIPSYGIYVDQPDAVCFEKML